MGNSTSRMSSGNGSGSNGHDQAAAAAAAAAAVDERSSLLNSGSSARNDRRRSYSMGADALMPHMAINVLEVDGEPGEPEAAATTHQPGFLDTFVAVSHSANRPHNSDLDMPKRRTSKIKRDPRARKPRGYRTDVDDLTEVSEMETFSAPEDHGNNSESEHLILPVSESEHLLSPVDEGELDKFGFSQRTLAIAAVIAGILSAVPYFAPNALKGDSPLKDKILRTSLTLLLNGALGSYFGIEGLIRLQQHVEKAFNRSVDPRQWSGKDASVLVTNFVAAFFASDPFARMMEDFPIASSGARNALVYAALFTFLPMSYAGIDELLYDVFGYYFKQRIIRFALASSRYPQEDRDSYANQVVSRTTTDVLGTVLTQLSLLVQAGKIEVEGETDVHAFIAKAYTSNQFFCFSDRLKKAEMLTSLGLNTTILLSILGYLRSIMPASWGDMPQLLVFPFGALALTGLTSMTSGSLSKSIFDAIKSVRLGVKLVVDKPNLPFNAVILTTTGLLIAASLPTAYTSIFAMKESFSGEVSESKLTILVIFTYIGTGLFNAIPSVNLLTGFLLKYWRNRYEPTGCIQRSVAEELALYSKLSQPQKVAFASKLHSTVMKLGKREGLFANPVFCEKLKTELRANKDFGPIDIERLLSGHAGPILEKVPVVSRVGTIERARAELTQFAIRFIVPVAASLILFKTIPAETYEVTHDEAKNELFEGFITYLPFMVCMIIETFLKNYFGDERLNCRNMVTQFAYSAVPTLFATLARGLGVFALPPATGFSEKITDGMAFGMGAVVAGSVADNLPSIGF